MKLVRRRVRAHNVELLPKGPFIIVGNHQSYLDPIPMWYVVAENRGRQTFFPSYHQLRRYFGRFGSWLGMMYIDPRNKADVLRIAREHLSMGNCIGIFPESRRNYASDKNLFGFAGKPAKSFLENFCRIGPDCEKLLYSE